MKIITISQAIENLEDYVKKKKKELKSLNEKEDLDRETLISRK